VTKHFNADFYVTCATVIPVLFVAVAVQGRTYESILRVVASPGSISFSALQLGMLILIAGGAGEALAIFVLYRGSEVESALLGTRAVCVPWEGASWCQMMQAAARWFTQARVCLGDPPAGHRIP
jgi:hypothetical protein